MRKSIDWAWKNSLGCSPERMWKGTGETHPLTIHHLHKTKSTHSPLVNMRLSIVGNYFPTSESDLK